MTAGYRSEGVNASEHSQPERQSNARKADPKLGKRRRNHGAAAAAENEQECSEKFREQLLRQIVIHVRLLLLNR